MGFYPVNKITITRDHKNREILVFWLDDVDGYHEKRFPFEAKTEALEFAAKEFNSLAM